MTRAHSHQSLQFFLGARTDREEVLTGMRIRPNGGFPPSLDVSCVDGEMRTK